MIVKAARYASDEAALLEATSPLHRTSHRLNGATTLDEVVRVIIDAVEETEADGCLIGAFERSFGGQPDHIRYLGSWHAGVRHERGLEISSQSQRPKLRPGVTVPLVESPLPTSMVEQFWGVADVQQDDGLCEQARQVLEGIDAMGCVNLPLRNRDRDVGHLLVLREKPGSFSRNSMRLFEVLGKQAAVALARAQQLEEARRRARREELASKATARMHESLDLESVLSRAVRDIGKTLGLAALGVRLGAVPASLRTGNSMPGTGGGSQSQIEGEEE
jgi:GAF domain-containing protein